MSSTKNFVICIRNSGYEASLERRKICEVLRDPQAEQLKQIRIIDESGESYLYPSSLFAALELTHPLKKAIVKAA